MAYDESMKADVPPVKLCAQCGVPLPADAPKGVCPGCELRGVLALLPNGAEAVSSPDQGPPELTPTNGRRFGNYELLEEIARGGMGVVYRARQVKLDRVVAVKMILAGPLAGKQFIQRFRTEAAAAALLQHPNIVAVHDVGVEEGQHYFSMDFVEGQSLAKIVGQQPLPPAKAARYVVLIAEAIHYAHEHGILHRDLKPSNVLIDTDDQPHVTDFGLAKRLDGESSLTLSGQVLGSPNFMPPEQAGVKRGKVGRHSDVYALGGILYYLLTARAPFHAESLEHIVTQVLEAEPIAPRLLNPSIPRDLERITLKCLEKETFRRYQTAQELADELKRFLRHEPIHARPVTLPEKLWRWSCRKPMLAMLIVLLHLVSAVGLTGILWQWRRAEQYAVSERQQRQRSETGERNAQRLLYASDISLAQQALKLNNVGKARRLLDRHRPQPGEEDLRGWEWRYLWQLSRSSALVTLTNRPTRGFSVSFSPDGNRLAVGWYDGRVDLWNVPARRLIRALTDREYPHQGHVAFSPVRHILAATSEPKVVTLYDLDSGRESVLWRAPDRGEWFVRKLTFSQDGSKVVIYAGSTPDFGDAAWVVNVSSSQIESHHATVYSGSYHHGAARLSPDNQRLYLARSDALNYRYSIQCLDLATGKELWQTELQRDFGLTALALSPDGRVLVSGSGFEDPTIRVWDTATGRLLVRLDGHNGWVCKLAFAKDGRRLISSATDQSIRFWDTSTWTETQALRGHTDEVHALAISETAQLLASASKDGDLMLWKEDGKSTVDGYNRLPENLRVNEVKPLDHSRLLLLPPGRPAEVVDLKSDSSTSMPEIGISTDVLNRFGTNILCHWDGTNQIFVRELRGAELIQHGAVSLETGTRPAGFIYNTARQLLAWTEESSSASLYLTSPAAPGPRRELGSNVSGLIPFRFSEDGNYLSAVTRGMDSLRAWSVETGEIVASVEGIIRDATFASGGRVLVAAIARGSDHEVEFHDLAHPGLLPRRIPGKHFASSLAVSPDGGLVALSTRGGQVRLFDSTKRELIGSLHGHLNAAFGIAFSADGRRLVSASGGREAVKLWDVGTRQELLTLSGTGSLLDAVRWSADGDVILAGPPWQAWRAPSWEEIAEEEKAQANSR